MQQEIAIDARHFTQLLPMANGAAGRVEKFAPLLKIGGARHRSLPGG